MTIAEELRQLAQQPVYHATDLQELQQNLLRLADQVEREDQMARATVYRQLGEALHRMATVDAQKEKA